MPLARKYRPSRFSELVGQDCLVKTLSQSIALNKEPHGVILSGVRGVGKTTTGRLYAKALNCAGNERPEPCNVCHSCIAIAKGVHEDVLEIDGASHTGVGDVRLLQETLEYVPQRSLYKVYIIDEVHMLSQAAFNALLKTLEEPPPQVIFVLATTELNKVPKTIVSRCQTFFLKKVSQSLIFGHLAKILDQEKIPFEDKVLAVIAREGHGSMRDAITLLDQAIALGCGRVGNELIESLFAHLSTTPLLSILESMVDKDSKAALSVIESLDQNGVEFDAVAENLAKLCRHGFVINDLGTDSLATSQLELDDQELKTLSDIAKKAESLVLNRMFRMMMQCLKELDGSALDRFVLENYIHEWCQDPGLPFLDDLLASNTTSKPLQASFAQAKDCIRSELKSQPPIRSRMGQDEQIASHRDRCGASKKDNADSEPKVTSDAKPSPAGPTFPETWRELVDNWKSLRPLQARKLEELHPISYSEKSICLGVNRDSFVGKSLLVKDEKRKLVQQFQELFAFFGNLEIRVMESISNVAPVEEIGNEQVSQPKEKMPESLLQTKGREREIEINEKIEAARNAPFTKQAMKILGGTIDDVSVST